MQRKMISLLGAAGLMAMTTVAAVSQNNERRGGAPRPPQAGQGRGVHGEVTEVDAKAGTISVASRWDETQTVKIGANAKILARKETTVGGLKIGDTIQVSGMFSQLTAASIQSGDLDDLPPPPAGGGRGRGGQNGRRGPGGMDAQRGPGGFDGPGMMGGRPGAPGGLGLSDGPNGLGGADPMGGPGGMGRPGGPDGGPGGPGEDGPPPPDGMDRADAGDQDAPRIRGRRVASGARTVAANGPGRPGDLAGGPDDFDGPGAPPPPRDGGPDDDNAMADGPRGGGPRGEGGMFGGGPRGEGGMRSGQRGEGGMRSGQRGGDMMGGSRGGRPMDGGPRGGGMPDGTAHLSGKIISLSPLTIAVSDSLSLVIKTDAKTHVTKIVSESLSDVKKGDRVFATGNFKGDTLTAKSVAVNLEP